MAPSQPQNDAQGSSAAKFPPRVTVGEYIGAAALTCLFPPVTTVVVPIAVAIWALVTRRRGSGYLVLACVAAAFLLIALLDSPFLHRWPTGKANEAETKANLHVIELSLEKYAVEHDGVYPDGIQPLIGEGYLPEVPTNPFTKAPMKEISFGYSPFEGEFTYVPVQDGFVRGYFLIGYGGKTTDGMDIDGDGIRDHVILVRSSNDKYGNREASNPPSVVLPDIKDLLKDANSTVEPEIVK